MYVGLMAHLEIINGFFELFSGGKKKCLSYLAIND